MNIICGCLAATEGEIVVNGHDIYDEPLEARRSIGYLPEIPPVYTEMTPKEYLTFIAQAKKVADVNGSVESVMEKTSISHVSNRLIRNLSKGYRQRVGIAQAILGDPEIIILDEPTVGLDPMQIIEIRDLIRELGKDHTVILSSHVLSEISATCDYVIVIAHGKIVASDTIENLNRSFSGTEILTVESRGNLADTKNCLSKVSGIKNIDVVSTANGAKCDIEVEKGNDIREDVFKAFAEAGISLVRLESNSQSLEKIFIKLVNEEHIEVVGDIEKTFEAEEPSPVAQTEVEVDESPYYEKKSKKAEIDDNMSGYTTLFGNSDEKEDK